MKRLPYFEFAVEASELPTPPHVRFVHNGIDMLFKVAALESGTRFNDDCSCYLGDNLKLVKDLQAEHRDEAAGIACLMFQNIPRFHKLWYTWWLERRNLS